MDKTDEANIEEIHYKDGKLSIAVEHPMVVKMASEFARLFKEAGGVNYVAMTMVDRTDDDKAYTVTIQPQDGKPVFEVNADLRNMLEELLGAFTALSERSDSVWEDIEEKVKAIRKRLEEEHVPVDHAK
jgi:hypothetical protein